MASSILGQSSGCVASATNFDRLPKIECAALSEPSTSLDNTRKKEQFLKQRTRQVVGISSSGFSNEELSEMTASVFHELEDESAIEEIKDGAAAGLTAGLAMEAGKAIMCRDISSVKLKEAVGDAAISGAAATILDLIIGPAM